MEDPIKDAIQQSQEIKMTSEEWKQIFVAFVLGGATSAFWTLRQSKRWPSRREWVSSFMVSGIISAALIAYLIGFGIAMHMVIFVSVMAGLGGDTTIRIVVGVFLGALKRVFNIDVAHSAADDLTHPRQQTQDPPTTKSE